MACSEESLKALFDEVDKDGNGAISVSELKAALDGKDGVSQDECKAFHEFVDQDGDKKVTFDEFKALFASSEA